MLLWHTRSQRDNLSCQPQPLQEIIVQAEQLSALKVQPRGMCSILSRIERVQRELENKNSELEDMEQAHQVSRHELDRELL